MIPFSIAGGLVSSRIQRAGIGQKRSAVLPPHEPSSFTLSARHAVARRRRVTLSIRRDARWRDELHESSFCLRFSGFNARSFLEKSLPKGEGEGEGEKRIRFLSAPWLRAGAQTRSVLGWFQILVAFPEDGRTAVSSVALSRHAPTQVKLSGFLDNPDERVLNEI